MGFNSGFKGLSDAYLYSGGQNMQYEQQTGRIHLFISFYCLLHVSAFAKKPPSDSSNYARRRITEIQPNKMILFSRQVGSQLYKNCTSISQNQIKIRIYILLLLLQSALQPLVGFGLLKCTLVQALRLCTGRTAHTGSRGIALLFLDHGTRRG